MKVHSDELMDVLQHGGVLTLAWKPATAQMDGAGMRREVLDFARLTRGHRTRGVVIDVREFGSKMDDGFAAWRREHAVPIYNEHVRRMAFLFPQGAPLPDAVPAEDAPGPRYETRYFDDPGHAANWAATGYGLHTFVEYQVREDVDLAELKAGISRFVAQAQGVSGLQYTSTWLADDERRFAHVVRAVDRDSIKDLQSREFFGVFATFLKARTVEPPRVRQWRAVASTL